MNFLKKCWRGEVTLDQAFWLVFFIGGLSLVFIVGLFFAIFVPNFFRPEIFDYYRKVILTIVSPYTLFAAICVWRCAQHSYIFWRWVARIIAVLAVVISALIPLLRLLHLMR